MTRWDVDDGTTTGTMTTTPHRDFMATASDDEGTTTTRTTMTPHRDFMATASDDEDDAMGRRRGQGRRLPIVIS
jgi:hypothetical protein